MNCQVGILVYNASMLTPDSLLSSDVAPPAPGLRRRCRRGHRGHAGRCPATRAAGGGTILFTGGGWADHPGPAWGTVSLGKTALRPARPCSVPTCMAPGVGGWMILGVICLIYLYLRDPRRVTEVGLVHHDGGLKQG